MLLSIKDDVETRLHVRELLFVSHCYFLFYKSSTFELIFLCRYLTDVAGDIETEEELIEKKMLVEKVLDRLTYHVSFFANFFLVIMDRLQHKLLCDLASVLTSKLLSLCRTK